VLLSIKTKLKLTSAEKQLMSKHAGIARFTYNWGLATWQNLYQDGLKPNKYILKKFFNNHVKTELGWIKEKGICQKITQYAFDHLGNAFDRFFKGLGAYPNFKKKFQHDSFTIDASGKSIPVGGVRTKLPTIGWIRTFEGLPNVTTSKVTISRIADDWYLSFAYEQPEQVTIKQHEVVGVDLGVKTLATLSTGGVIIQELYDAQGHNSKFIPITINPEDANFIPSPLRSATSYRLNDDGYESLYRRLTNQPQNRKPELGKLQTLAPRDRSARSQFVPFEITEEAKQLLMAAFESSNKIISVIKTFGSSLLSMLDR